MEKWGSNPDPPHYTTTKLGDGKSLKRWVLLVEQRGLEPLASALRIGLPAKR